MYNEITNAFIIYVLYNLRTSMNKYNKLLMQFNMVIISLYLIILQIL